MLEKGFKRVKRQFVPIYKWVAEPDDMVFKHTTGYIIAPIREALNIVDEKESIDYFCMSTKKAYNSIKEDESGIRQRIVHYLNYFIKYYDTDKEILTVYAKLKYLIDCNIDVYSEEAFINDLRVYLFSGLMMQKITYLNSDNYSINIDFKAKDKRNLLYTPEHVYSMLKMSTMMLLCIPLVTHYAKRKKIPKVDKFIRDVFDMIISLFLDKFDLESKLYESCSSNISRNIKDNPIWDNQDIRGINPTTHALDSIDTIIINIMPKYSYDPDKNPVMLNLASIKQSIKYKVTNIGYQYDYIELSSSNGDGESNNSDLDKYESYLIKMDESLYIQNNVNYKDSMKKLEETYGVIPQNIINEYIIRLSYDGREVINSFQKEIIMYMFYKYFGDTVSTNLISLEEYIKLMIYARRILEQQEMVLLPMIMAGRCEKFNYKKNLNAKDKVSMERSSVYQQLKSKYLNTDKILKTVESIIATILSSKFTIINPGDQYDGYEIPINSHLLIEEVLNWALMI